MKIAFLLGACGVGLLFMVGRMLDGESSSDPVSTRSIRTATPPTNKNANPVMSGALAETNFTAALDETNSASVVVPTRDNHAPADYGQQAYYFAREVCQRALKSPSSAKFSNPLNQSDTGWNSDGYYQWRVGGRVEAQNSFGAMIEHKWFAVVQYNTGRFEVVYFNLGGDEVGKLPKMRLAPGF